MNRLRARVTRRIIPITGMPVPLCHKSQRALRWKLDRLKDGKSPRVIDLFAGCGGISVGTQLAGCKLVGAVEFDAAAARSHALNFHAAAGPEGMEVHARARDITKTEPHEFIREIQSTCTDPLKEVDIIVGGPPCQAFARVGRAKLREIDEHPEAFLHDERSGLYRHYLKFVEHLAPVAVIVENVPDVLNYGGLNVFEVIAGALEEAGYECRYSLLNAAHYGVAQMRTRCFLVGIHRLAGIVPSLPASSHRHELPAGYRGTRDVALKHLSMFERSHFVETTVRPGRISDAVTARDALSDLPRITEHLKGDMKKAPQRLNKPVRMPDGEFSPFAKLMRNWPGFESDGFVYDHAIRFLPRDYKIFKAMKPGDQYPEAHALAMKMFETALARVEIERGSPLPSSSIRYQELLAFYVPPYDASKFPNKWRKMEADKPARTLMAHLGKDTYSHIHYDSSQARTISVREAARLQSFPDGFRFSGTMNPAFRQIGNAVPPLLAYAVASRLLGDLLGRESNLATDLRIRHTRSREAIHESVPSSR
jgi:DNA (cytosine-5)-methyltransferase 1